MQFNTYTAGGAHVAVWLVNHPSPDAAAIAGMLDSYDVHQPATSAQEATALRPWAALLREVFEAGAIEEKAERADALLVAADCRPRLVSHGAGLPFHFHYAPVLTGLAARVKALTAAGVAHVIDDGGGSRLRVCDRAGCGVAFIDTSRNGRRHFCCVRCANQVNVANHRDRRRQARPEFVNSRPLYRTERGACGRPPPNAMAADGQHGISLGHTGIVLRTVPVDSADDPRVADYTRLTDVGLRTSLEAAHGLFIAEGTKVIVRAVGAGYPVRSMLLARSRLADLPGLETAGAGDAPVYVVPDEVAERLTGYRVHRGALASLRRMELPAVADILRDASRIVVLEDLVDHGNVGAIFRCAAALGVDAVLLSPRCADPLYRRSVKVSMGAVFAIPYARMTEWFEGLAELKNSGFKVLALTPDENATPLTRASIDHKAALLLGTEGDGLSARWLHQADEAIRIPMHPAACEKGVDSLNVVAAAAIACHLLATRKD